MGKSSRIVLLSVTSVVAIAVFLVLWTVRPNSNSTLIAEARARQSQGLVTVDTTIDTEEAKAALLADSSFIDELAARLAGNEELASSVAESISDGILNEAEISARDAAQSYIEGYFEEHLASIGDLVDARVQAYMDEHIGDLETVMDNAIQAYVDEHYDELIDIINSEVDIESISNALADAIWADVEAYLATIDFNSLLQQFSREAATTHTNLINEANAYTDQQVRNLADGMLTSSDVQSMVDQSRNDIMDEIRNTQRSVVSTPDFSTSPVVTNESDYTAVREAERQGAIQALLNSLNRN